MALEWGRVYGFTKQERAENMASNEWTLSQRRTRRDLPRRYRFQGMLARFDNNQHRFFELTEDIRTRARLLDNRLVCLSQRFQSAAANAYVLEIDTSIQELQENPQDTNVLTCTCESFLNEPEEPCKHMILFNILHENNEEDQMPEEQPEEQPEEEEEEEESSDDETIASRVARRRRRDGPVSSRTRSKTPNTAEPRRQPRREPRRQPRREPRRQRRRERRREPRRRGRLTESPVSNRTRSKTRPIASRTRSKEAASRRLTL